MEEDGDDANILQFKVILIGDSGVGKTAIINRFSEGSFNENYITTIGVEFRFKNIEVNGETVRLQVWDTAGQERFRSITNSFYRGAQAIVVVYAVDDANTLSNVGAWLSEIDSHVNWPLVKYLVGNKSDLVETRCIDTARGISLSEVYGVKFVETSAKNDQNINELFTSIAKDIMGNPPTVRKPSDTVKLNPSESEEKHCC